jgi:hypothetical protein
VIAAVLLEAVVTRLGTDSVLAAVVVAAAVVIAGLTVEVVVLVAVLDLVDEAWFEYCFLEVAY